jgi:hypothetical protein
LTFLDSTCKQFEAQIKKATQNNQITNGNKLLLFYPNDTAPKLEKEQLKSIKNKIRKGYF